MRLARFSLFAFCITLFSASAWAGSNAPTSFFYAKVTIQLIPSGAESVRVLRDLLPKDDTSLSLEQVRNTELLEIGVTSTDSKQCAKRANELVEKLKAALKKREKPVELKVWETAEPAQVPAIRKRSR